MGFNWSSGQVACCSETVVNQSLSLLLSTIIEAVFIAVAVSQECFGLGSLLRLGCLVVVLLVWSMLLLDQSWCSVFKT